MRDFSSLSEKEILALTISLEEEDERVYADLAVGLRREIPRLGGRFRWDARRRSTPPAQALELYRQKFGEHIPLIRRQDIRGFVKREPVWLLQPLNLDKIRNQMRASGAGDAAVLREGRGAHAGCQHPPVARRSRAGGAAPLRARRWSWKRTTWAAACANAKEAAGRKLFLLQIVQPGLVGLMDGSVSTLAPVFAAALATRSTHDRVRGGTGGVGRSGDQHGIRRGAFGRRQPDRARAPVAARRGLRSDDGARRNRPHDSLLDFEIYDGDGSGDLHRRD